MALLDLFKPKRKRSDWTARAVVIKKDYEKKLKDDFGLSRKGNKLVYYGRGALDTKTAQKLYDANTCMGMISYLQTKGEDEFDHMCVIPGEQPLIILNAKPPLGLKTTLNTKELGDMIVSIQKSTKSKIIEHHNAFIIRGSILTSV